MILILEQDTILFPPAEGTGGTDIPASEQWRTGAIKRCRAALGDARTPADRLVLLRSLARLQHGRLRLSDETLHLSANELRSLSRFGLALTSDGSALRLTDEQDDQAPQGYSDAEALDSRPRAVFAPASPDAVLLRHSTHSVYRSPAQKAAVRALLTMPAGAGLMVSMPTGSGKSLLFQLASRFWRAEAPGSCVIVITPTVALALDHARTLSGIPGLERSRAFSSDLSAEARDQLLASFRRGEIPVLLLSPEAALGSARKALIEAATPAGEKYAGLDARLRAVFIDEAHIIESWGRSFRPDFQRLPELLSELRAKDPAVKAVLLSATLPAAARQVLRQSYRPSGEWLEIDARTPRYDFDIVVQSYPNSEQRQVALDVVIDRAPRPAVIYTTKVDDASELYARLTKERGYERIALFTGEISDPAMRRQVIEDWAADRLDLVVATSAFGMGVDKSNVRAVIHACLPESPARWYQEIGRASRDGHQGLAVCLFTASDIWFEPSDVKDAFGQATSSWLTREIAEARWHALCAGRKSLHWNGSAPRLTLDLDATREGLSAQSTNDYNRTWNMSLLNLMQRAGVLEVVSVSIEQDSPSATWEVELRNANLLDHRQSDVWDRISALRDSEQVNARTELSSFVRLMINPDRECLMRAVFSLIEDAGPPNTPPCGRCPACRAHGIDPPDRLDCAGLEQAWLDTHQHREYPLPAGAILVVPEDLDLSSGLRTLLHRLAQVGFEQYLVPDEMKKEAAEVLADSAAQLGLVLSFNEWVAPTVQSLARTATAVILPPDETAARQILRQCREIVRLCPELPLAVVARPERQIDDRRLDQTVSKYAPYAEHVLDSLSAFYREII